MRWLDILRLRSRSVFRRTAVERELDAELRFHLDQEIAEHLAAGMTLEQARRSAARTVGGLAHIADECRDARRVAWIDATRQDIRFAVRMLLKNPAFSLVAIATLALGVGVNTLAFSVARSLLFSDLPVRAPERLVLGESLREGFDPGATSLLEYSVLRRETTVFSSAAVSIDRSLLLRGRTDAQQVHAAAVSPLFFETLGAAPALGRTFSAVESRPRGPAAVVLSYAFWQRRFGGDPAAVGQSIDLDDRTYAIVGVMPRGFDYPTRTEAWIALDVDADTAPMAVRTPHAYIFVARLQPEVSLRRAADAVRQVALRIQREFPTQRGWSYGLLTMRQWSIGDDEGRVTRAIVVLLIAIGCLLAICCVNVASLLMVRGVARERELAIRVGLGASSWRVTRQLLTEGALLSFVGAGAGLLLAAAARPVFLALNPIQPHAFADVVIDFPIDRRALLFCAGASVLSGLMFTLVPALKVAAVKRPIDSLRAGDRRTGGGGRRWLRILVVSEIAIAVSLAFGGALLTKSFARLGGLDLGFRAEHLLTVQVPLSPVEYPTAPQKLAFVDRVLDRVRALPGVEAAGFTTSLPLQEFSPDALYTAEGRPPQNPSDVPVAAIRHVTAGYAETLGLTLLKGRLIGPGDQPDGLKVAVITEALARDAFGTDDPIGKRIRRGRPQDTTFPWMVVVGVVKDAKEDRLNFRIARAVLYVPLAQRTNPPASVDLGLVVRTAADPAAVANAVRGAIRDANPYQPLLEVSSMDAMVNSLLAADRFSARMMTLLAGVGLFLAAIGLYTVIAYSVSQRTAEIGLRRALGARTASVVALIAREGGILVGLGVAIAVPAMTLVARLLAGVLFGVRASDPVLLVALAVLLVAVAATACAVPMRRALRLDPVRALQCE